MKHALPYLLALLFALPAAAEQTRPTFDNATIQGNWQGTMVMTMGGEVTVLTLTMDFKGDKVTLRSPQQPGGDETQSFAIDSRKSTLTFKKGDKIDSVLTGVRLSKGGPDGGHLSMVASFGPPAGEKMPSGMSVKLYLAKIK